MLCTILPLSGNLSIVLSTLHHANLKGHFVVLEKKIQTQNFDIYSINEVLLIHNRLHTLFSEEK